MSELSSTVASAATPVVPAVAQARATRWAVAGLGVLLGLTVLYGIGFADQPLLHSAAHDARHAIATPCH